MASGTSDSMHYEIVDCTEYTSKYLYLYATFLTQVEVSNKVFGDQPNYVLVIGSVSVP